MFIVTVWAGTFVLELTGLMHIHTRVFELTSGPIRALRYVT
jgi:hypothetical protein